MTTPGWSVQETAVRLLCSEASVRRRAKAGGDLTPVEGLRPLRITEASARAVQAEMLRQMAVDITPPPGTEPLRHQIDGLERELQVVRGALADLTAAHAASMDTFRRLSAGAVPNN